LVSGERQRKRRNLKGYGSFLTFTDEGSKRLAQCLAPERFRSVTFTKPKQVLGTQKIVRRD
jgi:hypothetical protein